MFADDAIGHEESESRAVLLGCEVWLEEMVAIFVGDAVAIVGDAEKGRITAASAGAELDVTIFWRGINGVVHEVGDYFAKKQWVCFDLHVFRSFVEGQLDVLGPRPRSGHIHGPSDELVEVDRL